MCYHRIGAVPKSIVSKNVVPEESDQVEQGRLEVKFIDFPYP